jgi:CDP-glucose 4,6-dehydratase
LLKLCCDKALVKLGWKAVLDIDETVEEMVSWYKSFYNRENMVNITASQIEKYLQKAAARGSKWTK